MTDPLRVGVTAPAFAAAASDGDRYTLGDVLARQHVALFFYPGNDTPG